jgi:hypothetical protein
MGATIRHVASRRAAMVSHREEVANLITLAAESIGQKPIRKAAQERAYLE